MSQKTKSVDMVTACNNIVNYGDPSMTKIDPEDLRIHTKNICRYSGALNWKLIRHLDLCGLLTPIYTSHYGIHDKNEVKLQTAYAVSHDFHEVYCGDVVSGLKKYLPGYRKIEEEWETYVHKEIGLPIEFKNKKLIRYIDTRALVIEMTVLDHPSADRVAKQFGGSMTEKEQKCFHTVAKTSLDNSWKRVWRLFNTGKAYVPGTTEISMDLF